MADVVEAWLGAGLVVRVTRVPGGGEIVWLEGELDIACEERMGTMLSALSGPRVLIDLSGLHLMDASGVATLLAARQMLADRGVVLELCGARGLVRRVLAVLELDALLAAP